MNAETSFLFSSFSARLFFHIYFCFSLWKWLHYQIWLLFECNIHSNCSMNVQLNHINHILVSWEALYARPIMDRFVANVGPRRFIGGNCIESLLSRDYCVAWLLTPVMEEHQNKVDRASTCLRLLVFYLIILMCVPFRDSLAYSPPNYILFLFSSRSQFVQCTMRAMPCVQQHSTYNIISQFCAAVVVAFV